MGLSQASTHCSGEIGATADGFCQDHLSPRLLDQVAGVGREVSKAAAEATAPDLFRRKTEAARQCGIDQVVPLIVGNDSNPEAATDQNLCRPNDCRGLPGAQETTNTRNPGHFCR